MSVAILIDEIAADQEPPTHYFDFSLIRAGGFSIKSTMRVSTAASSGGGPGALVGVFFAAPRFVLVLVTRFLSVVLAATGQPTRLGALARFGVAFRAAPGFLRCGSDFRAANLG